MKPVYNVFVTHAWRYHADWTKALEMLETDPSVAWRNFSIPWHDPAFDANTPLGKARLHEWLESQIRPADVILFLDGVYTAKSTRRWLALEIEIGRQLGKLILALPDMHEGTVRDEVAALCDDVISWDTKALAGAIKKHRSVSPVV